MAYYSWNVRRMYGVELEVVHMNRNENWLAQLNSRARVARRLAVGTERAYGWPWLQPVSAIRWQDACSPFDIVVPSNKWMPRS